MIKSYAVLLYVSVRTIAVLFGFSSGLIDGVDRRFAKLAGLEHLLAAG